MPYLLSTLERDPEKIIAMRKARDAARYAKQTPEQRKAKLARNKAYRDAHPEMFREAALTYYRDNKEKVTATIRKKKYGITQEVFTALFNAQKGACRICGCKLSVTVGSRSTHVDHNHKTGEVRGLLCLKCNTGLGAFSDSPERLQAAIKYLIGGENGTLKEK
jgi:hypothetical protein